VAVRLAKALQAQDNTSILASEILMPSPWVSGPAHALVGNGFSAVGFSRWAPQLDPTLWLCARATWAQGGMLESGARCNGNCSLVFH